ncbi:helix-turn-helix transcriptional regulator [Halorubrum sp. CGM4_25_10-8A]|uniref:helix-turn-helix transcriptional regulator n=1 Tax=Halorubrum sp. CGM4_25_10-8A TaxID=2518116 RepID=UPI0010F55FCA|nr:helix-turn-helix transcriptional regulator [Halorubrum sp. CGM4_25_10-8A]TKX41331.1 PadR family transcriptional regulator [Halorubrum sp. CGM4_25_10-8A]
MSSPHTECDSTNSVADLSAVHRDLLWILAQTGPCENRHLQQALTTYHTDDINHSQVYDALEELIERDFVTIDDTTTYQLTEAARRALSARQAWQAGTTNSKEGSK